MIRVVLVDDQALIRGGLRSILEQEPDITVVGEAGDGQQAVEVCRRLAPDVVLMDVEMPVLDGISAARALLADGRGRICGSSSSRPSTSTSTCGPRWLRA